MKHLIFRRLPRETHKVEPSTWARSAFCISILLTDEDYEPDEDNYQTSDDNVSDWRSAERLLDGPVNLLQVLCAAIEENLESHGMQVDA